MGGTSLPEEHPLGISISKGKEEKNDQFVFSFDVSTDSIKYTIAIKRPLPEELDAFFKQLRECGTKPAIVSVIDLYMENYVSKAT